MLLQIDDPEIDKRLAALGIQDDETKGRWLHRAEREALHRCEHAERFEDQLRKAHSSGPGRSWTDADWEALKRSEYLHPPEPDSWAVPSGWKSRRLK